MTSSFQNVYQDGLRAEAYASLEFPGTYHLAFRDLPLLLRRHAAGSRALDFGCGTGRSTRFLRDQGWAPVGIDIAEAMLGHARQRDPHGSYLLASDAALPELGLQTFDVILAAFTFDNVPTSEGKLASLRALQRRLSPIGRLFIIVSTPEIYRHEWASFSTRDFPENLTARTGDRVRIVMLDVPDARPVEDVVCSDGEYRRLFRAAHLEVLEVAHPLGRPEEPYEWVSELTVPAWAVYVLGSTADAGS